MTTDRNHRLCLPAFAKINLSLDVLRKRRDGYHDVHMVMQQVALHDRISINLSSEPGIRLASDAAFLPGNRANIAWRAAELLGKKSGINIDEVGVEIDIEKRIPTAAGLAGGSADAAAVLKGLNQLWRLGLSLEELQALGLQLGADVPYCLMGGAALAEGIGERLTPLSFAKNFWVVLVRPSVSVSTREVYQRLDFDRICEKPDNMSLIAAMKSGDVRGMAEAMANVLESVTIPMVPEIGEIKQKMLEFNASVSLMSGSGPTVFGLFKDRHKAEAAVSKLSLIYREAYMTHTLPAK